MGKRSTLHSDSKSKGKQATSVPDASKTHARLRASSEGFPPCLLLPEPRLPRPAELQTLLSGYVWVVPNFFTPQECSHWIDYAEREGRMEHTIQRGTRYMAQRECYRTSRDDPVMSCRIFRRLEVALQRMNDTTRDGDAQPQSNKRILTTGLPPSHPNGCNPNLRLYKYTKGHSFGKHVDESVALPDGSSTRLTALIYLSSCQGGATRFYDPRGNINDGSGVISFQPAVGALLLHLHGNDCLEHEGDVVTGGTKYVLRTDVSYR